MYDDFDLEADIASCKSFLKVNCHFLHNLAISFILKRDSVRSLSNYLQKLFTKKSTHSMVTSWMLFKTSHCNSVL